MGVGIWGISNAGTAVIILFLYLLLEDDIFVSITSSKASDWTKLWSKLQAYVLVYS